MGRFDDIRERVAELIDSSRDEEPEPEGFQGEERSSGLIRGGVLEHDAPRDDLNFYRQLYENVGPIKSAIDNYSSEVVEPGWYITADDEETAEELTEYFKNVAIINTETDGNASKLFEAIIREREIKGTVFLEKVTDSQDRNQALYPLQNDTISIYTKPGKAMLPAPDDSEAEPFDQDINQARDTPPTTSEGEMGAYVQFDELKPQWSNTNEVIYTRNQVLKWTRDAEIGNPRGTSRLAASSQRAEGLLEKLQDNDDAVKFKAWPQIIFQMGDEDNPWSEEEVMSFIENYEEGKMSPGMMQAVAGDVSVEEFAGETADISDTLEFDISMIMSGLPGPVYATGGFSQNIAPAVAQQQQRTFIKEVKKTRREIENLFTPYLQEVAEDYGLDAADSVELHLGRPQGEIAPEDVEGSIIRYSSDVGGQNQEDSVTAISSDDIVTDPDDVEDQQESSNETTSGSGNGSVGPSPNQTNRANQARNAEQNSAQLSADSSFPVRESAVHAEEVDTAELADPRLVSTQAIEQDLADLLYESFTDTRDRLLSEFRDGQGRPLREADEMERVTARVLSEATDDARVGARSRPVFEDTIEATLDTLGQESHSPQIERSFGTRHREQSRFLSDNMAKAFENVVGDMETFVTINVRQAVQHQESLETVADRIENQFTDSDLRERAQVMARIEAMSAVNSTKLREYQRQSDVVGVSLINPCNNNTTEVCQQLACDDDTTARFDADESLGEQFQSQLDSDDVLFDGFDPLPTIPPFHFGCRTELVPVTEDE